MKEIRDGAQSNRTPLALDVDDFKGDFSFDDTFGNLVTEVLPSCLEKEVDSLEGHDNIDGISNGHMRAPSISNAGKLLSSPLFPEVDALLSLFKNFSSQLVEQKRQVDAKLSNLTKEVSVQDLKHRKTLAELEKGVDGLFGSFARLDSRISSVGHTAAKIGDHLQSADTQRESASQTIELIKYLMEFNRYAADLTQLSLLFIDDNRVAEAASIAQKLRSFADEDIGRQRTTVSSAVGNATSPIGLEVAITNLQEYCNVINADAKLVLGDEGAQPSPSKVAHGLSSMFKKIADTVRKEVATIATVFPSLKDVMSILVQYLRFLAVAYEKTQEFDKELRSVGCGDLDVEGAQQLCELIDVYESVPPVTYHSGGLLLNNFEQTSCFNLQMDELRSESQLSNSESCGTIGRSKGASIVLSNPEISVTMVTEFVRWNEEAISGCSLFYLQPAALAASIKPIFTCLLDQVSQYIIGGLERAREGLTEAAALREKYLLGTSKMQLLLVKAVSNLSWHLCKRCGSSVAILQQYFVNSISRRLLPVDGAHAASSEEMATSMSRAESVACKGLQQCIETVIAEVERLLSTEQKATDYRSPDDGIIPDHRPTSACACAVAYLSRVLESAFTGLEGRNKQAFMTELVKLSSCNFKVNAVSRRTITDP
uniref:Exocyst complex component Sec10 n=1 Tax=Solanum lycopersicum TaxID=4081 RepID=A0A3Q7IEC1_SOLLC